MNLLFLQCLLPQDQGLDFLAVLVQEFALQPVDRGVDHEAMIFKAWFWRATALMMRIAVILLSLRVSRAYARVDVDSRVVLRPVRRAHVPGLAHSWLHRAAHIQRLHALIDAYTVEDTQPVALPPAASEDDAVAVAADSLDLSINLLAEAALLIRFVDRLILGE